MTTKADGSRKDVLIVVMGTSGSGKSTLGASLAEALHVRFVDGDDLHPAANVEKMSSGQPLDDADRLPWLLAIRAEATRICRGGSTEQQQDNERAPLRDLAEEFETSQLHADAGVAIMHEANRAKEQGADLGPGIESQAHTNSSRRRACVIACSALKRNYRHLLRYGLLGADATDPADVAEETRLIDHSPLDVYHVYVTVTVEELLRRMQERKGHFMKESMLKSQLATLEEPDAQHEPRTLVMANGSVASLVNQAKAYFDVVL